MNSQQLARGFKNVDKRMSAGWKWFIAFLVAGVIAIILYPVFAPTKRYRHRSPISNIKQLIIANLMYAQDHDDSLPLAESWMDALGPYTNNEMLFVDPLLEDPKEGEYGIAFFKPLSGIETTTVFGPDTVPLVFQSRLLGRNAASNLSTLPTPPRYKGTHMIGFLDGHAKSFRDKDVDRNPKIEFKPSSDKEED